MSVLTTNLPLSGKFCYFCFSWQIHLQILIFIDFWWTPGVSWWKVLQHTRGCNLSIVKLAWLNPKCFKTACWVVVQIMKVFKTKKDVKLTCSESLCLVKVAEYPISNTGSPATRPSLSALQDVRFSSRVEIWDESDKGSQLLHWPLTGSRCSKPHNSMQTKKRSHRKLQ